MDWFWDLIQNPFFIAGLSSWFIAQVAKTIIHLIINRKLVWERLMGDGGMPSGHSATVTALAMTSALIYGTGSFEFAVTAILAIIVCHDAMGVRLETGKQAIMINEIIELLSSEDLPEVKLKELVGHTPIQVTGGVLIGAVNAVALYLVLFS